MAGIDVRRANEGNLSQIIGIGEEIFTEEYKPSLMERSEAFFLGVINSPFSRIYVPEVEKKVAGFSIFVPQGLTGTHELFQIGIKKSLQNQGIGTELLRQSMDQYVKDMRQNRIDTYAILLMTAFDNPAGQNLYKKCGFEITGTISDTWIGLGDRQVAMTRILDRSRRYNPGTLWNPDSRSNKK